jgi:hypothetical protein
MFAITNGLYAPESFQWNSAPELIVINDLWQATQTARPGLLIRVRTESNPDENMTTADSVESVIGLIDSTTRWRAALTMLRGHIAALRNDALVQACWGAHNMMMQKHPAAITQPERENAVKAIAIAVESLPKELMQSVFESRIASGVARFVSADNDVEAAYAVPFAQAMVLGIDAKDKAKLQARIATIETMAASVLITEAAGRLAERVPEWLFVPPPAMLPTGAEQEAEREEEVEPSKDDED